MLTGQYEATSWATSRVPAMAMVTATNFVHIFPASTNFNVSGNNEFGPKVCFYSPFVLLFAQVLFGSMNMPRASGP